MLLPGVAEWLSAFWELSTDRALGLSVGPIPSSAIDRYAQEVEPEERPRFRYCMRMADQEFMKRVSTDKPPKPAKQMSPEIFDSLFG